MNTICAIASGENSGGIGIIRVSGDACKQIASDILKKIPIPRYAHYGNFYQNDKIIDKGIALYFPAPNSFTGEDVLELQGHGGRAIMNNILQVVIAAGAKLAAAGEFSKRAFLNGKIDLVQAEAIADMITTESEYAAKLALNSLQGEFSKKINNLRKKIINLRVFIEATIDFVDEEIDFINDYQVAIKIKNIITILQDILRTSKQGAILRSGISVAIIGKPNAGKSSLLNALTMEDSAIVTSVAGTTRDIIKEKITLDGMPINIIDTAGIRYSADEVENIGIKRAKEVIKKVDIVLLIFVSGEQPDLSLCSAIKNSKSIILVQNKIDIKDAIVKLKDYKIVKISAKNKIGINQLTKQITKQAGLKSGIETLDLARTRHIEELKESLNFIQNAAKQLNQNAIELVAEDLTQASIHLGKITGEFSNDDLLSEIFSSFCIGK